MVFKVMVKSKQFIDESTSVSLVIDGWKNVISDSIINIAKPFFLPTVSIISRCKILVNKTPL